ncbi:DUF1864 family protein [Glycomyces sp. A-F 0318]|uniref:monodechloroaminopyrrolnitrin synthase PrnB family protein n=1 Tax=Glycomyces amatae TaxID=2881355 RepID=UPI001E5906AC|nr:monodechloroaminopyrrolnitrin synthase PrnB family protein [Glycomyces amatae]MCD0444091.1 DUF1864 family protein [Glycomyces amatae]
MHLADPRLRDARFDGARTAGLDPLGADGPLAAVPAMNAGADVRALTAALRRLTPSLPEVAAFDFCECLAAMRDLGLLLGSIKRHGVQPLPEVPGLETVLVELGRRTEMIPRDTVHHYTEWNPLGPRQRMYTGDPQETVLMGGPRASIPELGQALERCAALADTDVADPAFAPLLQELGDHLAAFETVIADVVARVSPEFFAQQMRPYYEEVAVAGRDWLGPAAAHVPLYLADLALWASDDNDPAYEAFLEESAEHTLPAWRGLVRQWRDRPSIVRRLREAAEPDPAPWGAHLTALHRVMRSLVVFRGRHLGIARKAYKEEVRLYELGSGGGSIGLLQSILDLTRENAVTAKALAPAPAGRTA